MRIAVAATPAVAIPTLDWLRDSEHDIAFVITQPDKVAGRGKSLRSSDVARWANEHQITLLQPEDLLTLRERLASVDLLITIAFGAILPAALFQAPTHGSINLHFSLLPAWRGAAPVQRAIENGDHESGVTVFALDAGMDTGPIYSQIHLSISPIETTGQLLDRMAVSGVAAVHATLEKIAQGVPPVAQTSQGISRAKKISKQDARIDWEKPAKVISDGVRAFNPIPGAWTTFRSERVVVLEVGEVSQQPGLKPGEVFSAGARVIVGCGAGQQVELLRLIPSGKRVMSAHAWSNGARLTSGEFFV